MKDTICVNANVSSFRDLLIWRLFYFLPIYTYLYLTIYFFINDYEGVAFIFFLALIPFAVLWLFITTKTLSKLRKKKDYVTCSLSKSSLSICDGRIFDFNLSDIEYINWDYFIKIGDYSFTLSEDDKMEINNKILSEINKIRDKPSFSIMERMIIQTSTGYIRLEVVDNQNIEPEDIQKVESESGEQIDFQLQLTRYLIPLLGKVKERAVRTNRSGRIFVDFFMYMGKRRKADYIYLDTATKIGFFCFTPIAMMLPIIPLLLE